MIATPTAEHELETARQLVRAERWPEAEQAFQRLLAADPDQPEALRCLANAALARGAIREAIDLLNRCANLDRNDISVLLDLGIAYRIAERYDASRYVFERVLELSPGRHSAARLLLANVLEWDQRPELALLHYFRALLDAQLADRWIDDNSTEPDLRQLVQHAVQYVAEGRRAWFDDVLQPFRNSHGMVPLQRIDRALAIYLRERAEPTADSRQRPSFLYIPDLGASPILENSRFAWLPDTLARIAAATVETEACWVTPCNDSDPCESAEGHGISTDAEAPAHRDAPPCERRTDIYRRGVLTDAVRQSAAPWLAALTNTPLVHIPRHGPDIELIALPPGIRTTTRYGRSNSRCSAVVALHGSARADIVVGGEWHSLDAGNALVVDESFGVAYANACASQVRLLVVEIWHPDLSPGERDAITALISAVVNFDTRLQELA
jgi:aspartate beta-hydroxylase